MEYSVYVPQYVENVCVGRENMKKIEGTKKNAISQCAMQNEVFMLF